MPPWIQVVVVVALVILAIATVVRLVRGSSDVKAAEAEAAQSEEKLRDLQLQLAIQTERLTRLPVVEAEFAGASAELTAEREAHARARAELAATTQACTGLEGKVQEFQAARGELQRQVEIQAEAAVQAERGLAEELTRLKSENATLRESLAQERKQSEEKLALLHDARALMTKEFNLLANEVMSKHGESFKKENKEQLDVLLAPLRDKLKEFQEGLQNAHLETGKDRAALAEQIRMLSEQSAKMNSETLNLTRALKGNSQTQGAWGEMILASLLQKSGLREGEEYLVQTSHDTEDGRRLRPDVIVNLPNGQHVVIDAKVSLVAFENCVNAETEDDRRAALASHLASMRTHIKNLASKEYQALRGGGLDYVIMFVPIEGALAAALQSEPGLTTYAAEWNVAIATPATLLMALRTIDNVWKVERRNQNAEAIAARAGALYDKFVGFIADLEVIGRRIDQAQHSYSTAFSKLKSGSGNLIGQAEKLKSLGAKASKSLPPALVVDELDMIALPEPDTAESPMDGTEAEPEGVLR